jgi:hypothetical protein
MLPSGSEGEADDLCHPLFYFEVKRLLIPVHRPEPASGA